MYFQGPCQQTAAQGAGNGNYLEVFKICGDAAHVQLIYICYLLLGDCRSDNGCYSAAGIVLVHGG